MIEGDAYAIEFTGYFPTIRDFLKRGPKFDKLSESEQLKKIAKSFGGAATDHFVIQRNEGIVGRVKMGYIKSSVRSGFTAVKEVLTSWFEHQNLSRNEIEKEIAMLLQARESDRIVRNLSASLIKVID